MAKLKNRITYKLNNIINPEFVGLISAPMEENYVLEDIRKQPDIVKEVTDYRYYTVLDKILRFCRTKPLYVVSVF